ncbi:MAG TPA: alpha/beta hydrolase [Allosphingosinicella sp.]|jgi:pimeloyl-ACP methyl ester carboxylesterase|nr:alpha/beta hydrolase [Allosphingosinicella sp.]
MRRTFFALAAALLATFPGHATAAPGDLLYAKPGRLVPAGDGARLDFHCTGKGAPTVILDSGALDWSPPWALVQPRIAQFTRVCSYDRAGTGFSTPGPMPRTSMRIAAELHSALRNAGIRGPYILVGNAFGGDNVRAFADLYPRDVAGLVMAEADASDVEPADLKASDDRGDVGFAPAVRACGAAVAAGKPALLPHREGRPDRSCAIIFFRGLPDEIWSPALNAALQTLADRKAEMYAAFASELEQMPADEDFLQSHKRTLGATPVRVITTRNHGVHRLDPQRVETAEQHQYQERVAEAQARWLDLSSDAKQIFPEKSSEYVQFDAPDIVAAVVRDVWERAKRRKSAR